MRIRYRTNRRTRQVFPTWKYSTMDIDGTAHENLPLIREDYISGGLSIRQLSEKYGILEEVIRRVVAQK